MKHLAPILLATAALPFLAQAQEASVSRGAIAFAEATNEQAFTVYTYLRGKEGNVVWSPYSFENALAMLATGAAGSTRTELMTAMHLGDNPATTGHELRKALAGSSDRGRTLYLYGGIFTAPLLDVKEDYTNQLLKSFGAKLQAVEFSAGAEAAAAAINRWVGLQTNDRLTDVITPSMIHEGSELVLIDALTFEGQWQTQFDPNKTNTAPFYTGPGASVQAQFMQAQTPEDYVETETVQALRKGFNGDFDMVFVLPKNANDLAMVEKSLDAAGYAKLVDSLGTRNVMQYLPRFEMELKLNLTPILRALGAGSVLTGESNFSKLSATPVLVDTISQKVKLKVDEEGAKAEATTAVASSRSITASKPAIFRANHPFLFYLVHRPSGAILFQGRVSDPTMQD